MPSLPGVIDALMEVRRGLPASIRTNVTAWIRSTMSTEAVVADFEALFAGAKYDESAGLVTAGVSDGTGTRGNRPPHTETAADVRVPGLWSDDVRTLGPEDCEAARRLFDFGVLTTGHGTAGLRASMHEWTLTWSAEFGAECDALTASLSSFLHELRRKDPTDRTLLMIMTSERSDGSHFPSQLDLEAGRFDSGMVALVRTERFVTALSRWVTRELDDQPGNPSVSELLIASLGVAPVTDPKMGHLVVATEMTHPLAHLSDAGTHSMDKMEL